MKEEWKLWKRVKEAGQGLENKGILQRQSWQLQCHSCVPERLSGFGQ